MNKLFITFLVSMLPFGFIFSQLTIEGRPESFSLAQFKTTTSINTRSVRGVNIIEQIAFDREENIENRYAIYKDLSIDIKRKGTKTKTSTGNIWRYKLMSKNALSMAVIFSEYKLPEGATLFFYSQDRSLVRGAYSHINNKPDGKLAISDFPGSEIVIEYYEPGNASFSGKIVIGQLGRAYRDINEVFLKSTTGDQDINITCDEGSEYQDVKHAVARMTFKVDGSGYLCTGALINNTRNDGTPYFLTANHCLSTYAAASTLITYFNYERENCSGSGSLSQSLSGSMLKATNVYSDVTLLELTEDPPIDFRPYFAGWNIADTALILGKTVGIHHPGGAVKKIAISYDSISSFGSVISWEGKVTTLPHTHWLVYFKEGFTEGGSSGSSLFDMNDRIIGQLHGGGQDYDFYGKLNSSWDINGVDSTNLKPHLDPDNSQVTILDAYIPDGIVPEAFFHTAFKAVCIDEPVSMIDGSAFDVDTMFWHFAPSTVQFLNGTTENSENPIVTFQAEGLYSVSLKVSNTNGADSTLRGDYVIAGLNLAPEIIAIDDTIICYKAFDEINFKGAGADSFKWGVISGAEYITIDETVGGDYFRIVKNESANISSTVAIDVQLTGYHGSCVDSVVQQVYISIPSNDLIENAYPLSIGDNGIFTNDCATASENEPHPTIGDCKTPLEWCDCELGGLTYIENSLWFTFTGPPSGLMIIDCRGFDNQIAVYEAASAADIMSGNNAKYTIIGASDDFYSEAFFFAARINNLSVSPDEQYWLQVDGSACGASGEFSVVLVELENSGSVIPSFEPMEGYALYPNPIVDEFTLVANIRTSITVKLFTIDGKEIKNFGKLFADNANEYHLSIPAYLVNGMYLLQISDDKIVQSSKISVLR